MGVGKLLNGLAEVGAAEVKKAGVFTIPGLARIKTRRKPATKASKRMMFGKEVVVKAKPAKTVVKHSQQLLSRALFDLSLWKANLMSHRVGRSTAKRPCSACGLERVRQQMPLYMALDKTLHQHVLK